MYISYKCKSMLATRDISLKVYVNNGVGCKKSGCHTCQSRIHVTPVWHGIVWLPGQV